MPRLVACLQLDHLPALAEQHQRPAHRASPLVVTTEAGRHVLAASPQALAARVRPGITTWEARLRCPGLVCVPEDQDKYRFFFSRALAVVGEYTPLVEPLPPGGMFADLTGTGLLFGPPERPCARMLASLRQELHLLARCGLGPNKLAARLACALADPGRVHSLGRQDLAREVSPLPLSALPGLSPTLRSRLAAMGLHTLGDLAALPDQALGQAFGPEGRLLASMVRGEDGDPVQPCQLPPAACLQELLALEPGTDDPRRLRSGVLALCERLGRRLRAASRGARSLHLGLGFRNHRELLLVAGFAGPTCLDGDLFAAAGRLLDRLRLQGRQVCLLRLAALGLRPQAPRAQFYLPLEEHPPARDRRLAVTLDAIRDRYGEQAISRAGGKEQPAPSSSLAPPPSGTGSVFPQFRKNGACPHAGRPLPPS